PHEKTRREPGSAKSSTAWAVPDAYRSIPHGTRKFRHALGSADAHHLVTAVERVSNHVLAQLSRRSDDATRADGESPRPVGARQGGHRHVHHDGGRGRSRAARATSARAVPDDVQFPDLVGEPPRAEDEPEDSRRLRSHGRAPGGPPVARARGAPRDGADASWWPRGGRASWGHDAENFAFVRLPRFPRRRLRRGRGGG